MRIGFITTDWSNVTDEDGFPTLGGSAYYRIGLPYQMLKEHGYDVHLGAHLGRDRATGELGMADWREDVTRELDIIVLHRWMEDNAAESILGGRAAGQIVVNDVDDHFDGIDPRNQAFITTHPRYSPKANREHYKKALAASSALTVSTPFFESWAKERWAQEKTYLLRNMIDLRLWTRQAYLGGPPAVGWVGMTSHRSGDLESVGSLRDFLEGNNGRFHHSGAWPTLPSAARLLGLPESIITSDAPPVPIHKVPDLYQNFNIGIVPLRDIAFNHAKSCIKGMEYAAAGIPFVASSTPEYEWLRSVQNIGLTARRAKDWKRCLRVLADEETRIEMGKQARKQVEALDSEIRWSEWASAYTAMLADLR